ncbi:Mg-protoporphyrin IX methyl transferase [Planctomycetes bacterium Poly30]|uniref:Mg-protoporphyrin IX methyl transferase n=1 Tax=Saltatorellus ferox TaxID=2528018 RepID=A0A518EZD3_9BACT|nr:Mg-protoporphyrin IX methyl transferase [Planctomycetes bacterium Poly30]
MTLDTRNTKEAWWVPFYDDLLAETLLVREDPTEVEATVDFLMRILELAPGSGQRVLDQCCGIGSLSGPLAARGFDVLGVDQSAAYVERARRDTSAAGQRVNFVAADASAFTAEPACDAGFNWWTSYGYAPTREHNRNMLRGAFRSLAPGALFALDTMNLAGVLRAFQEEVVVQRETPRGLITMTRRSRVDLASGRLLKRWTYEADGEQLAVHDTSLMLSMPHELGADLEAAGFRVEAYFAGIDGASLTLDDPRCIVLARRPA